MGSITIRHKEVYDADNIKYAGVLMSNGALLEEIKQILKEEQPVPPEVSQRLIIAALIEVYKKLNKVEDCAKTINTRLVKVEATINGKMNQKKSDDTKVGYLKWAIEKAAVPVLLVIIAALLAYIFGG